MRIVMSVLVALVLVSSVAAFTPLGIFEKSSTRLNQSNPAKVYSGYAGTPVVKPSVVQKQATRPVQMMTVKTPIFESATPDKFPPRTTTLNKRLCPNGGTPVQVPTLESLRGGAWTTQCVPGRSVTQTAPTFPKRESGFELYDRFTLNQKKWY